MNPSFRTWLLPSAALVLALPAAAKTVIYPVEAIADFWKLDAAAFETAYSGINITGMGVGDEGWYIRYRHENLTMLFGPISDREEARQRMWDLEEVRAAVIRQRQTLATSQVDMVRFDFSGVYGARGEGGNGLVSRDGRHGPDGDLDGDGVPNGQDPDMDGDGVPNEQDGDMDGDGVPNEVDEYRYGNANALGLGGDQAGGQQGQAGQQQGGVNRISADGRSGPDGDLDGDGISNAQDGDMDGDGTPNGQDGDADGDGRPNASDDYPFGTNDGTLSSEGGQPGQPGQQGQQQGQQGQPGQQQQQGQQGQQSQQQQQQQQGQQGQPGQPSMPSQQGQPGSPSQPSMPGQPGSPSAPNPLDAIFGLLRRALGL